MIPPTHGGQLRQIAEDLGLDASDILDFSANINPAGPPAGVLASLRRLLDDPSALTTYPELELIELRTAIACHLNSAPAFASDLAKPPARIFPDHITVANGFAPLLEAAIRSSRIVHTLLPVPAFGEYRTTLERNSIRVTAFSLPLDTFTYDLAAVEQQLHASQADSLLLANPQNPSGVLTPAATLLALAGRNPCTQILLDEAFIDYAPGESLTQAASTLPNLMVFRSVTKFFAMPALRVAYVVANSARSARLQAFLPPWPVSTLAASATIAALTDDGYAAQALHLNRTRRTTLVEGLAQLGVRTPPAAANFLLLRFAGQASPIWSRLLQDHHILLRQCLNFEALTTNHLRAAVRDDHDNARLLAALASIL